jgi:hypothetical protein
VECPSRTAKRYLSVLPAKRGIVEFIKFIQSRDRAPSIAPSVKQQSTLGAACGIISNGTAYDKSAPFDHLRRMWENLQRKANQGKGRFDIVMRRMPVSNKDRISIRECDRPQSFEHGPQNQIASRPELTSASAPSDSQSQSKRTPIRLADRHMTWQGCST